MPELRRGATNHRWVIVAPERGRRPSDFEQKRAEQTDHIPADCPFCAGNEHKTPPEIYRYPVLGKEGWYVRVIPNKFPALQDYTELGRESVNGLYERMNGIGAHEVIIETPDHCSGIPDLPEEQVVRMVETYIHRLKSLMENPQFRHVLLFKNHGKAAGASLSHPHSQIIATPIVPQEVKNSLSIAKAYYERKERCLFCDIILAELRSGERVVEDSDGFVTWAPYASRFPFELVIYPKEHSHDFTTMDEGQRIGLARTLIRTTLRLKTLLGDIPYNFVLETAPNPIPQPSKPGHWTTLPYDYHWRIVVMPRLTRVAGFEWGTGFYINPMPPEEAARFLREIKIP
jgi:UDPglucose--hexose-1-phosphate uridylyltransferase